MSEQVSTQTIPAFLAATVARRGDEPALGCVRGGQLSWRSWRVVADDANRLAEQVRTRGIQPDDRVAHVSENRYEWVVTDLAIHLAGVVHVPIHTTLSGQQMAEQIADCGARLVFVSTKELLAKFGNRLSVNVAVVVHDEQDDEVWRAMLEANLETVHRSLRALLPSMVARKRGAIVALGSRAAVDPGSSANAAAYAASKAATVALVQAVAAEVRDHGVRINAVLPSTMDTPANRAAMPDADPSRWVSLASAAGVVAFLLGDEARDISGAAIPVYGRA